MTLGETQREFPLMIAALITWAYEHQGWALTFGEAYRSDEQSEINAMGPDGRARLVRYLEIPYKALADKIRNNQGSGIRTSLHGDRLAIDLNFFINGVYQTDGEAYRPLAEKWESLGGTSGISFGDANHFSLEWEGRR